VIDPLEFCLFFREKDIIAYKGIAFTQQTCLCECGFDARSATKPREADHRSDRIQVASEFDLMWIGDVAKNGDETGGRGVPALYSSPK